MLVDDMLDEVRLIADEKNENDVTDEAIVSALNRAQKKLVRIATRKYNPMFTKEETLVVSSSTGVGVISPLAVGWTVNGVEVVEASSRAYPLSVTTLGEMTAYRDASNSSVVPRWYAIVGDKIHVFPKPQAGLQFRIRFQMRPPELDVSEGRIVNISQALTDGHLYLDTLGSKLSTDVPSLSAFINIIDGNTGAPKATLQLASINVALKRITIKTSALGRTTVWGRTVGTEMPADVALDDYITLAHATCIPTLVGDYDDYLIQHAAVEILRNLGVDNTEAYAALKELEADVQTMWAGRPANRRVRARNPHWNIRR